MKINAYVDDVMVKLCFKLGISIPQWTRPVVVLESHHKIDSEKVSCIVVDDSLLPIEKNKIMESKSHRDNSVVICANDIEEPCERKVSSKINIKEESISTRMVETEATLVHTKEHTGAKIEDSLETEYFNYKEAKSVSRQNEERKVSTNPRELSSGRSKCKQCLSDQV